MVEFTSTSTVLRDCPKIILFSCLDAPVFLFSPQTHRVCLGPEPEFLAIAPLLKDTPPFQNILTFYCQKYFAH